MPIFQIVYSQSQNGGALSLHFIDLSRIASLIISIVNYV